MIDSTVPKDKVRLGFVCLVGVYVVTRYLSNNLYLTGIAFVAVLSAYFQVASAVASSFQVLRNILLSWVSMACVYLVVLSIFANFRIPLLQPVLVSTWMCFHVWRLTNGPLNLHWKHSLPIPLFVLGGVWTLINAIPFASRIAYLGLGYDNYGHLAHARMLFQEQRLPWPTSIENYPSHLSSAAQGSPSALAFAFGLLDSSRSVLSQVTVFLFISACLPIVTIAIYFLAMRSLTKSLTATATACLLVAVYLLTGYLSRVWVFGHFASTLAVVLMCCLFIDQLLDNSLRVTGLLVSIGLVFSVYALFGAVILCLLAPSLLKNAKSELSSLIQCRRGRTALSLSVGTLTLCVLAGFTFILIRRGYSIDHFLVGGGIEPLPVDLLSLSGLSLLLVSNSIWKKFKGGRLLAQSSAIGLLIICGAIWYSKSETGMISYYPTKVVISVWICLLLAGICVALTSSCSRSACSIFVIMGLFAPVILANSRQSESAFPGAFMGTLPRAITFPAEKDDGPVSGLLVMEIARTAEARDKVPILLSQIYDSELNTRWINVLTDSWNDRTWSNWITLREMLTTMKYSAANSFAKNNEMLIVLDSEYPNLSKMRTHLPRLQASQTICVIVYEAKLKC
jgi:hypothetical protein